MDPTYSFLFALRRNIKDCFLRNKIFEMHKNWWDMFSIHELKILMCMRKCLGIIVCKEYVFLSVLNNISFERKNGGIMFKYNVYKEGNRRYSVPIETYHTKYLKDDELPPLDKRFSKEHFAKDFDHYLLKK